MERPILMSAPMVRACLDGSKMQTRRVVKPQPEHLQHHVHNGRVIYDEEHRMWCWKDLVLENIMDFPGNADRAALAARCPYGAPGDTLWVKETFAGDDLCGFVYRAEHPNADLKRGDLDDGEVSIRKWKPSIFMPRWASRLTLRITDVRVERLQEITEADARAEGLESHTDDGVTYWGPLNRGHFDPVQAYRALWESINGKGSWDANPWVWVVSFERVAVEG